MSDSCETCLFWVASDSDDYRVGPADDCDHPGHGMCRKRAPVGLAASVWTVPRPYEEYLMGYWPMTYQENWCGEYRPAFPDANPAPK